MIDNFTSFRVFFLSAGLSLALFGVLYEVGITLPGVVLTLITALIWMTLAGLVNARCPYCRSRTALDANVCWRCGRDI